ncbi:TPA: GNAT family N-acetyltransferase [Salmonella enterica subsp. enterica serovar Enteritidis]|uniref:GNAT family N-acetyltransferase n=1 Tax=Salmonella enterica TaxID=28901 RepID=UPI0002A6F329|nr:N-acetyltransferase [Salmonella enterica]EDS7118713.1 GNAT family N-acetyltransferase [Salmonella enterica subsp. enterica]ELO81565.1 acetyltransferase [Salmonella enterica subsp. enterica serovar Enteritidis str. SARB17]EJH7535832.1 GNAT family N-acetyltransferase [Salmonella enterica]EJW2071607.1 GNAT family N-acetyltransferase [Salmonella enterica]EJW2200412.1 GNAT family N-acetyltransferase [Salmonella enterica]
MLIRPVEPADIKPLLDMLQTSGQFDEMGLSHVQETLGNYLSGELDELWFSAELQGLAGIAYCAPEVMTNNVWNLLMLWVSPSHQRQGVGQALISQIEKELRNKHARLLLVETSSLTDFGAARAFYCKQGFINEARIRNYYAINEDKLIFTKDMQ